MKKRFPHPRLGLHRETLRRLEPEALARPAGGLAKTDSCYDDCCSEVGSNCVTEQGAILR